MFNKPIVIVIVTKETHRQYWYLTYSVSTSLSFVDLVDFFTSDAINMMPAPPLKKKKKSENKH